ncbi:hypothetical protein PR048_001317 [Dryococelus australis]|uniref:Uncharacterized protein n=1 Tax=Dryococelus australis TaxID=614101 RepID=A0ABQ9IH37_9NEOP|nr:hypothetical protein PR048_001317 [Dryococelus australis]
MFVSSTARRLNFSNTAGDFVDYCRFPAKRNLTEERRRMCEFGKITWLDYSPSKANRVRFPADSLPDFRTWETCQKLPLVGGLTRGCPALTCFPFWRCSILTSLHLIGSRDLDVKSRPNLFTHSFFCHVSEDGWKNDNWRKAHKIDFKRAYTEVIFAIGSEFIMHALDDSEPIADLQENKMPGEDLEVPGAAAGAGAIKLAKMSKVRTQPEFDVSPAAGEKAAGVRDGFQRRDEIAQALLRHTGASRKGRPTKTLRDPLNTHAANGAFRTCDRDHNPSIQCTASPLKEAPWDICVTERGNEAIHTTGPLLKDSPCRNDAAVTRTLERHITHAGAIFILLGMLLLLKDGGVL